MTFPSTPFYHQLASSPDKQVVRVFFFALPCFFSDSTPFIRKPGTTLGSFGQPYPFFLFFSLLLRTTKIRAGFFSRFVARLIYETAPKLYSNAFTLPFHRKEEDAQRCEHLSRQILFTLVLLETGISPLQVCVRIKMNLNASCE